MQIGDWGIGRGWNERLAHLEAADASTKNKESMEIGDWVVAAVNSGTVEGIVHKKNPKRFVMRLQVAGKIKHVTRRYRDLVEVVDFYS